MKLGKLVKELRRKLHKDEESTSARLKRAALYREIGRGAEAVELYRSVVADYIEGGRIAQAIAVCRSALDLDAGDAEFRELLVELERLRDAEPNARRQRHGSGSVDEGVTSEDDVRNWAPSLARSRTARAASSMTPASGQDVVRRRATTDEGEEGGARRARSSSGMASGVVGEEVDMMSSSSRHLSISLLTPTPLPAPLPAHEADDDSLASQQLRIDPAPAGPLPQIPLPGDLAPMDGDLLDMPLPTGGNAFDDAEQTYLAELRPVPGGAPGDEEFTLLDDAVTSAIRAPALFGDAAGMSGDTSPGSVEPTDHGGPILADAAMSGLVDMDTDEDQEPTRWRDSSGSLEPAGALRGMPLGTSDAIAVDDLDAAPAIMSSLPGEAEDRTMVAAEPGTVPGAPVSDGAPELIVDEDKTIRQVVPATVARVMPADADAIAGSSRLEILRAAFAALPEEAVGDLADRVTLRRLAGGAFVFREGEPGDACFLVESGEVRGLRRDPFISGEPSVEVCRWGPAALFGEIALLADRRRHASAQAMSDCCVYEIPRRLLRELAATYPHVGSLLDSLYRERMLSMLIDTAPFLRNLSEERRTALRERFQSVRRDSGEQIVREGATTGGLYLVVLGSVEITKRVSAKRSSLLATFVEGAYFGDMSFVDGDASGASVSAAGPVELAVLPPEDFLDVVAESPGIWAQIRRTGRRQVLESNELLTGEIPIV